MSETGSSEVAAATPSTVPAPPMFVDPDILTGIERGGVDAGVVADLLPDDVLPQESTD